MSSSESGDDLDVKKALGEEEEDADYTLANADVSTKYQEAAKIANAALDVVLSKIAVGKTPLELSRAGDEVIEEKCKKIFTKKVKGRTIEKGVAFPTCVSINECVCHNSPLASEAQEPVKEGDLVKVDLGVHIDGFVSVVAHTVRVGPAPTAEEPIKGPVADVFLAALTASEVAIKLIKPGNSNKQVTEAMARVAEAFGVNAMQGTLMHQMKRYIIDGNKVIILREDVDQKVDDVVFEQGEIYSVDVAFSSGEGKPREATSRTTVFKRAVDVSYRLKMKASRYVFNEMNHRFPTLPFTLRALEDEKQARMGVVECLKHDLLHPYPVLMERPGDIVVHFKATILLLPSGTAKVTGLPYSTVGFVSDKELPEDIKAILATSSKTSQKKKKKKKDKAAMDVTAT
ncbi:hypothetical protein NSK_000571 [Nannochloropsis salina CCMP1776]|uniref:Peptidase M24 domain-containing protein n=1 Tax=Nannochloropsis salina CCMP1776 TaxID=1027361 RepID=A0A4D9D9V2_9STRA|nr:hypothetical protein NSK_000571 [Nannochloropsis salina CCMP1776]|eukprot:TFJ88220.1 hypothetical protein NSK_000571 [Nannochloropsis salina CCMP1776]